MGQVLLRVRRFSPVSIVLPVLHIHLLTTNYLMLIARRTSGRNLGTVKSVFPWMSGSTGQQNSFQRCIVVGVLRSWRFPVPGVHKSGSSNCHGVEILYGGS